MSLGYLARDAYRLHLACVQPRSDLDPERSHRIHRGLSTSHRSGWSIEGSEESVAGCVDLAPAIASEEGAYGGVVPLDELTPTRVSEFRHLLRRLHDVGEEHRGEDTVKVGLLRAYGSEEALHLTGDPIEIATPRKANGVHLAVRMCAARYSPSLIASRRSIPWRTSVGT
jgi:hypothetical protein